MALTIGGIVCQELVANFGESYDRLAGPQFRKSFLCGWADRFTVANAFLGLSSTVSIGGLITLQTPLAYPDLSTAYATHIDLVPVGNPTEGARQTVWPNAIVNVTYGCLPWSFSGFDYMQLDGLHPYVYAEQGFNYTSEWITVPKTQVFYSGGTVPLDQDWGFRSPLINFSIMVKYVPYLNVPPLITALASPINSVAFLGCAAGKLLFNGAESRPSFMVDGTRTQNIEYSFSYRPIAPWDYVYKGGSGWVQVVDSTNTNIQQRSDLSTIIPGAYR